MAGIPAARAAFNYKNLPYRTEWIEYPDLASKLQSFGIAPNDPKVNPNAQYSIPAATFPDGSSIMDSFAIVQKLEQLQPEPSLRIEDPAVQRTQSAILKLMATLGPEIYSRIPDMLLNPPSATYFQETRAKRFGMPLDRLETEKGGETAWSAATEPFNEIKAILSAVSDGPYILGQRVSFADFILAGFWRFVEKLDRNGDLFGRIMETDEKFVEHYKACEEYLKRDD